MKIKKNMLDIQEEKTSRLEYRHNNNNKNIIVTFAENYSLMMVRAKADKDLKI